MVLDQEYTELRKSQLFLIPSEHRNPFMPVRGLTEEMETFGSHKCHFNCDNLVAVLKTALFVTTPG